MYKKATKKNYILQFYVIPTILRIYRNELLHSK
jgi:hypothetical protein